MWYTQGVDVGVIGIFGGGDGGGTMRGSQGVSMEEEGVEIPSKFIMVVTFQVSRACCCPWSFGNNRKNIVTKGREKVQGEISIHLTEGVCPSEEEPA